MLTPWCEVWGSPIAHSLSPVLHRAAYASLGLDWAYGRREVDAVGFADALAGVGEGCRGLSLTMPLKEVALAAADVVDDAAGATGAANTLVPTTTGWSAHNTDVDGIRRALADAGATEPDTVLVIGSGATARSTLAAVGGTARRVVLMVRDRARPETLEQARAAGLPVEVVGPGAWTPADVVVSTVPPASVTGLDRLAASGASGRSGASDVSGRTVLLDVVYGGGTTPLERAAVAAGWEVAPGTDMLLHQATRQVELMTGRPAPLEAMRAALDAALAERADRGAAS
ncbi:shikimate dehydrogenase [Intrasporangium sp. YIM S08009]|uniref:shikimate dehydrogenase n=1 Tax=Intrasporangium zincisolvens TaxID=3080018 RepID=UPI002B05A059|nr:shikimate dehydrogenase [Intrasporangium sp. YIM S08009]